MRQWYVEFSAVALYANVNNANSHEQFLLVKGPVQRSSECRKLVVFHALIRGFGLFSLVLKTLN